MYMYRLFHIHMFKNIGFNKGNRLHMNTLYMLNENARGVTVVGSELD